MDGDLDPNNKDDLEFIDDTIGSTQAAFLLDVFTLSSNGEHISFDVIKHMSDGCDPIEVLRLIKRIRGKIDENIKDSRN